MSVLSLERRYSAEFCQIFKTIRGLLDREFVRLYKPGLIFKRLESAHCGIVSMRFAERAWFRETISARSLMTTGQLV